MKVAVFGSWTALETDRDWHFRESHEAFKEACRKIGDALARKGHTLIVEFEAPHVADLHVVEGYVAAPGTSTTLKIELAWTKAQGRPFERYAQTRPGLFAYHPLPASETDRQRWSNSHLVSLKHANAILTIGGREGTYLAGSAAIVANKPLVPIASFGGASERLLKDLEVDRGGNFDRAYYDLNDVWSNHVLERAMGFLDSGTSKAKIFISHAHEDEDLARALVDMITKAFELSDSAVRCTSVPGYKLPAGVHTASQLRNEIEQTEFVLGVITPRSIESKYVLLELGAAWGLGKRTFPLVACGIKASSIPGPLGELHWIDLTAGEDCHQLIDNLSSFQPMGGRRKSDSGALVAAAVDKLVTCARQETKRS
jgi:hypothetical protein